MNVKKLKHDLWDHLSESLPEHPEATKENPVITISKDKIVASSSRQAQNDEPVSFQDIINDMSQDSSQQKDVSLSFYFICLLHLANEKVRLYLNSAFS